MSVYGIDVSHWEGLIDWLQIRQDGRVKFAIHKATEGTTFVDSQYKNNRAGCQAFGIPWAAYHYFRPSENPIEQARHFYDIVGDGCYIYVVDIETTGTNLASRLLSFIQELKLQGAPKVVIYTGPYFWHDNVGDVEWAKEYDLWIANYGVATPMIPLPWTSYRIWQFSDNGRVAGIDGAVDEDWFSGDLSAMYDYFKNGNEVPEPPGPMRVKVNVANLTLRSAPVVTTSTVLGYTSYGKVWEVEDSVVDAQGRNWVKVGASCYMAGWLCVPV